MVEREKTGARRVKYYYIWRAHDQARGKRWGACVPELSLCRWPRWIF